MKFRKALDQIKTYTPAKSLDSLRRSAAGEVIKLAANENSWGFSPRVSTAIIQALPGIFRYPDPGCGRLKDYLAAHLGVDPGQLVFGDGSFELLSLLAQVLVDPGDEVIIPERSFGWYTVSTLEMAGRVVKVPLSNFKVDPLAILAAITERTKLIWFCNPHNPMGTFVDRSAFEAFLAQLPSHVVLALDEAYHEFATDPDYPQSLDYLADHPNIIVLRTFSKAYGLAGLRIGYAVASPEIIQQINKIRPPINVNSLAQAGALAALADQEFKDKVVRENLLAKVSFYQRCNELGLDYLLTQTNFIMVKVKVDSDQAVEYFLSHGVAIRSGNEFDLPGWLRITLGTPEENQKVFLLLRGLLRGEAPVKPEVGDLAAVAD